MGSVLVGEVFVFAQDVPQMTFIPQRAAVEQLASAGLRPSFRD
ncbi:hypothetical protein AB0H34_18350 [Saccharopolyspora shandongensis]